jgi:hypothetical protein
VEAKHDFRATPGPTGLNVRRKSPSDSKDRILLVAEVLKHQLCTPAT